MSTMVGYEGVVWMSTLSGSVMPLVDVVIAIDTSISMKDEAVALSEASETAIEIAKSSCPSDLQVAWLGVEGTWRNTHFDRTLRELSHTGVSS
jgi:hypothetical protein